MKKQQHYIPQGFLKERCQKDGKLFVYNKNLKLLNKKYTPKSICYKDFLYELNIKNPNNIIENFLQKIEDKYFNRSSKALKLKDIELFSYNEEIKYYILLFTLRLSLGNPSNKSLFSNIESKKSLFRTDTPLSILVGFRNEFINQFMNRKKILFILSNGNKFALTSDNPVLERVEKESGIIDGTCILSDTNFDLALSPYIIIRIVDKDYRNGFKDMSISEDKKGSIFTIYNRKVYNQSIEYIYSNIKYNKLTFT